MQPDNQLTLTENVWETTASNEGHCLISNTRLEEGITGRNYHAECKHQPALSGAIEVE